MFYMDLGTNCKFALCNIKRLVLITEVESVYSAVRTESLYTTDTFRLYEINPKFSILLCLDFEAYL